MEIEYKDKTMKCANCGQEFNWSATDQEFYFKNNYVPPKRCKRCRALRAEERKRYGDK